MNNNLGRYNFFRGSSPFQALLGPLIFRVLSDHQDKRIELFGKDNISIYQLQWYT